MLAQEGGELAQALRLRLAETGGDERGGDVEAVEDVADIVEHASGDLGHAGQAGSIDEFLAGLLERLLGLPGGRNVLAYAEGADHGAGFLAEGQLGGAGPGGAAVGPGDLLDLAHNGLAGAHDRLFLRAREVRMPFGEKIGVGFPHQVVRVFGAMAACLGFADGDETAVAVFEIDQVRDVFQEGGDEGGVELLRRFGERGGGGKGGVHDARTQAESLAAGDRWRVSAARRAAGRTGFER